MEKNRGFEDWSRKTFFFWDVNLLKNDLYKREYLQRKIGGRSVFEILFEGRL